jgi:hypothetical protein
VVRSLDFVYWLACCSLSFLLSWVFFPLFCVVPCIIPHLFGWMPLARMHVVFPFFLFFLLVMLFRRYRPSFVRRQSSSILATLLFFSISFPCALLCPNLQMVTPFPSLRASLFYFPSIKKPQQKQKSQSIIAVSPKLLGVCFFPFNLCCVLRVCPPCLFFLIRYPDRRNPFPSFIVPFDPSNLFCISPLSLFVSSALIFLFPVTRRTTPSSFPGRSVSSSPSSAANQILSSKQKPQQKRKVLFPCLMMPLARYASQIPLILVCSKTPALLF